jgi:hypothetical protein
MSEDLMRNNLFVLAQRYATGHGLELTTVSKKIHGNQRFLEKFLAGQVSCTLRMYFLMVDKIRATWPKEAKWPETREVPRLVKVPSKPRANRRPQGPDGKFLGKIVHKVRGAPIR